jgi:hypothetical protein
MICCDGNAEMLTPCRFKQHESALMALLESGCKYACDDFTAQDVADWFSAGKVKLWAGFEDKDTSQIKNLTVTNTVDQVTHNELCVLMWTGIAWDWDLVHFCINAVALVEKCTEITIRGRRGFLRRFRNHGAVEKYTVIKMEVKQ